MRGRIELLHSGAGARQLAALRIAVFGVWFVVIAGLPLQNLALLDERLISQRGVMAMLPVEWLVSSPTALIVLQGLVLAGCLACVLGVGPHMPVALCTAGGVLIVDGLAKSAGGYVSHGQAVILYCAFIVAIFPAADRWSVVSLLRRRSTRRAVASLAGESRLRYVAPMQLCALVLALSYSLIGARRMVWGGLDVITTESPTLWLVTQSLVYGSYPFDWGLYVLEWSWLPAALAVGVVLITVMEVLSPLVLISRRFRYVWVLAIVPFYVATLFTLRIFFWENLVLIAVLMTGLTYRSRIGDRLQPPRDAAVEHGSQLV